jgi:4'-phosphopantetheinyl transferase
MEPTSPVACSWPSPSELPDLRELTVHVWCVSLEVSDPQSGLLLEILSPEERQQAGRMRFGHVRQRFVARRAALRRVLGRYLNARPEAIRFERGAYGKPSLALPWAGSRIRFSAAHSGGLGLAAVSLEADLGIDLEQIRPIADYQNICRRYFAPQEQEALRRLPETERLAAFFRAWARKEAILKAIGTGLSLGLDQVVVPLEPGPAPGAISIQGSTAAAKRWRLEDLQPAAGYEAALAGPAGPWRIECFRWSWD